MKNSIIPENSRIMELGSKISNSQLQESMLTSQYKNQVRYSKSIHQLKKSFMMDEKRKKTLQRNKIDIQKLLGNNDFVLQANVAIQPSFTIHKERFINLNMKFDPEIGKILMKIKKQEDPNQNQYSRLSKIDASIPNMKRISKQDDKPPTDHLVFPNHNQLDVQEIPPISSLPTDLQNQLFSKVFGDEELNNNKPLEPIKENKQDSQNQLPSQSQSQVNIQVNYSQNPNQISDSDNKKSVEKQNSEEQINNQEINPNVKENIQEKKQIDNDQKNKEEIKPDQQKTPAKNENENKNNKSLEIKLPSENEEEQNSPQELLVSQDSQNDNQNKQINQEGSNENVNENQQGKNQQEKQKKDLQDLLNSNDSLEDQNQPNTNQDIIKNQNNKDLPKDDIGAEEINTDEEQDYALDYLEQQKNDGKSITNDQYNPAHLQTIVEMNEEIHNSSKLPTNSSKKHSSVNLFNQNSSNPHHKQSEDSDKYFNNLKNLQQESQEDYEKKDTFSDLNELSELQSSRNFSKRKIPESDTPTLQDKKDTLKDNPQNKKDSLKKETPQSKPQIKNSLNKNNLMPKDLNKINEEDEEKEIQSKKSSSEILSNQKNRSKSPSNNQQYLEDRNQHRLQNKKQPVELDWDEMNDSEQDFKNLTKDLEKKNPNNIQDISSSFNLSENDQLQVNQNNQENGKNNKEKNSNYFDSEESLKLESQDSDHQYLINRKRGTIFIPNQLYDSKVTESPIEKEDLKDLIDQALNAQERKSTFVAGSVCCFFFIISSFLWVILFSDLSARNDHVQNVIMSLPTNEDLHKQYTRLYKLYDKNQDILEETLHYFSSSHDSSYSDFKKNLKLFEQDYDFMNYCLRDIKVNLFRLMNSFQSGRLLDEKQEKEEKEKGKEEKEKGKEKGKEEKQKDVQVTKVYSEREIFGYQNQAKLIIEVLNLINKMKIKLESLRKYLQSIQGHNKNVGQVYQQILLNTSKLFKNNFKMINEYGGFYQLYSKIWAYFQEIMKENQEYLNFITEEIGTEHYQTIQLKAENLNLNQFNYLTGNQIQNINEIVINYHEESFLDCQIQVQVDPSSFRIDTIFDLKLIINNDVGDNFNKDSFDYGSIKQSHINISQLIRVNPGLNFIRLFAMVKNSDVLFKEIKVNCLQFKKYRDIPNNNLIDNQLKFQIFQCKKRKKNLSMQIQILFCYLSF